jgi:hypothetical protein
MPKALKVFSGQEFKGNGNMFGRPLWKRYFRTIWKPVRWQEELARAGLVELVRPRLFLGNLGRAICRASDLDFNFNMFRTSKKAIEVLVDHQRSLLQNPSAE